MSEQNQLKVFHDEFKDLSVNKSVEAGAQVNVIESISLNGVEQPVTGKNADLTIDLSDCAKKSDLNVLSTTPSTVDGGIWFEFQNHYPVLKIFYGGEEFTFSGSGNQPATQSGGQSASSGVYYFSRSGTNLIENYIPDEPVLLEEGLDLTDGVFATRGEYKDLVLTFGDDTTATIRTTTAAALESLDTQGREILFVDHDERRNRITFYDNGRIVHGNAITLSSDFADSAFAAGDFTNVTSKHSPISIQGSTLPSMLKGGSENDTLVGNSGNDTFTGDTGWRHAPDLFVVKLVGDNVITDFEASDDRISLVGSNIDQLQRMSSTSDGLKLDFGSGTLMLAGFENGKVIIDNTEYKVEGTTLFNDDRTAATYFAPVDVDLDDTIYSGISSLDAKGGGTIQAGSNGVVMSGNSAVLIGGNGADTFFYNGGDITVGNYASGDCISLGQGYTLEDYDFGLTNSQRLFTVRDTLGNTGYVVLNGLGDNSTVKLWQTPDGQEEPASLGISFSEAYTFNSDNKRAAMAVTVNSHYGDFGVFSENEIAPSTLPGTEYYSSLMKITATQPNTTLIGGKNANTFEFVGGEYNSATGGIGKDTFNFTSCGGEITDFGVASALKTVDGKLYAKNTTTTASDSSYAYNRTNPLSYVKGADILKVNGTITRIAIDKFKDSTSKNDQTFSSIVYYTDIDGNEHTIELKNIVKPLERSAYETNNDAAKTLNLWDLVSGESAKLSSAAIGRLLSAKD